MIRLLLTVTVGLFVQLATAFSQVSVYTPSQSPVSTGQTLEIPILVKNFQNIIGIQFAVKWDSTVLDFVEVKSFNLPALSLNSNFGLLETGLGNLRFNWYDSPSGGITKTDGDHLFKISLKVIGANLTSSFIKIDSIQPDFPIEIYQAGPNGSMEIMLQPTPPGQIGVGFTIATRDIDGLQLTDLYVFPNPFSDRITVRPTADFSSLKNCRIRLTDCMGRLLFEKNEADLTSDGMEIANLISYFKGIYFLTIQTERATFSTKVVKLER